MSEPGAAPLIVTLQMEDDAFARFDALRRRHFPEALNHIPAHVTLFHHLPGGEEAAVTETLDRMMHDEPAPQVTVSEVRFLGRGVAFGLDSAPLAAFRKRLAQAFDAWLTPQDRQGWRPHVTVQNKVAPQAARALADDLAQGFSPFRFTAPGLLLWRYLGGPWEPRAALLFGGSR